MKQLLLKFAIFLCYLYVPHVWSLVKNSVPEDSIFNIYVTVPNQPTAGGTAFLAENYIFTNLHVIRYLFNSDSYKKYGELSKINATITLDHQEIKVKKIKALSALYDVAILEVDLSQLVDLAQLFNITNPPISLSLRENTLDLSEQMVVSGYPDAFFIETNQKANKMEKLQFMDTNKEQYGFFTDYEDGIHGFSGSPVLDSNNQVAGIVHSGYLNFFIATSSTILNQILNGITGSNCDLYKNLKACVDNELSTIYMGANNGDKRIQYWLGVMHQEGMIIPQNKDKKFYWIQKAAEQQYAPAMYHLGALYDGFSIKKKPQFDDVNKTTALYWYRKSAKKQFVLGQMQIMLYYAQYIKNNNIDQAIIDPKEVTYWASQLKQHTTVSTKAISAFLSFFDTKIRENMTNIISLKY